ncbi:SIR2 family protein [Planococcus halotolerans]|uniref:SIR2 family protein n=1 Tax=Planococcus halotolerans TaxID=2233542 RepID=UPI0010926D6D|nr:SIR2 family protein [Planococcus halotolerans]QHJ69793.1 hypothetical protein DNR44_003885 [Planococcus halotolerans]
MDSHSRFLDEISGKSINFLIGSGASAGVIPTLWIKPLNKSFEDLLTSSYYTEDQRDVLYFIWFNIWIRKTLILEEDDSNREVIKDYTKFISNLVAVLNNEGFDKPKRINIFTTNYDTFFELSFDKIAQRNRLTYFNDGSRGFLNKYISSDNYYINASHSGMSDSFQRNIPTINLLKMHGSVTWIKKEENISVSLNNEVFEEVIKKADEIDTSKVPFFSEDTIIENFSTKDKDSYSEDDLKKHIDDLISTEETKIKAFKAAYNKLSVVNPTKVKFNETVFEQHYYQMLRLLSHELERKNSILIVFGFSFADEHILEIVRRSIVNPHLKTYIIGYDEAAKKQIKDRLEVITSIDFLPNGGNKIDGYEVLGNFNFLNSLLNGRGDKT